MTGDTIISTTEENSSNISNLSYTDLNNLSKVVIELLESNTIKSEIVKPIREL